MYLIFGKITDKLGVSLSRLVHLSVFTQGLVVAGERHGLGLLQLEPVDCHLEKEGGRGGKLECFQIGFMEFCPLKKNNNNIGQCLYMTPLYTDPFL